MLFGIRSKNNHNLDNSNFIYFLGAKAPVKKVYKIVNLKKAEIQIEF